VNHQRLMARLARRVTDRRLLVLIGAMLKAKVVMPDGVVVSTEEGVPQGGPLSPLLSNIVLDELRGVDQLVLCRRESGSRAHILGWQQRLDSATGSAAEERGGYVA